MSKGDLLSDRCASTRRQRLGIIILMFGVISAAFAPAFALEDTYLRCKGSITRSASSGRLPRENTELALHITAKGVNISDNAENITASNMRICSQYQNQFTFNSQSCALTSQFPRPRTWGTYNTITGNLQVTMAPDSVLQELLNGEFICSKTQPLMK